VTDNFTLQAEKYSTDQIGTEENRTEQNRTVERIRLQAASVAEHLCRVLEYDTLQSVDASSHLIS
jgi:hypothetical protein